MAILQRGFKGEVTKQLDPEAAQTFAKWIGCYGVIWNCKVAENKSIYQDYLAAKDAGELVNMPKPSQAVSHFITEERPWLSEVPSQIRRNAGSKFLEAFNACIKGLRKAPRFKRIYDKKNCLVTNELFDVKLTQEEIEISFKHSQKTAAFCTLVLPRNERMVEAPKMIWLQRRGARFWLSFSYLVDMPEVRDEKTIIEQLSQAPLAYQEKAVIGLDLGVIKPVALSTHQDLGYTPMEAAAIKRKHARRFKYQRKMSRQREMAKKNHTQPGKNYEKSKAKVADSSAHIANIRSNMAHRVSKEIAEQPVEVVVCENLNIKNMTKRPKAKQDPITGIWQANGSASKAGLNKSILNIGWGQIIQFTQYKLRERDKVLVFMPAHYSSQECAECDHIAAENRQTQESFICVECGHADNADFNSANVLKNRFLKVLNQGTFVLPTKTVKRIAVRRQQRPPELRCQSVEPTLDLFRQGIGNEAETS